MIRSLFSRVLLPSALVAGAGLTAALPAQVARTSGPAFASLTLSSYTPKAGSTIGLVLAFSGPVVEDSLVIQLQSSDALITLPATVVLRPRDGSQLSVNARVGNTRSDQQVTLSATVAGHALTASVSVFALRRVRSVTFANDTVLRGGAVTATVTLDQPAPADAVVVTLSHGGGLAIPATLAIHSGFASGTFTVAPQTMGPRTVTASLNGSNITRTLTVLPEGVVAIGLELPYASVSPGVAMNGTILAKALELGPGGAIITLSASPAGILTIPASVTVTEPNNWLPFPITVGQVPSQTTVTITATVNAITKTVQLSVNP